MNEQRINPDQHASSEADDGWEDPWFREETRVPECGPPYPEWARDSLTPQLIDTARDLLAWIVRGVWGPASYALQREIWQWKKFELLDWLRPLEMLLRRMLLIEAFALAGSQTLPRPHSRKVMSKAKAVSGSPALSAEPKPACATPPFDPVSFDPARPDTWRVVFISLPGLSPSGPRHKLPPVQFDRAPGEKPRAFRYRRKLVSCLPLARRLEAAIRVINNPLPFVRRLAFKLRRGRTPSAVRLIIPRARRYRFATDALALSGNRAAHLADAYWGSG